MDIEPGQTWEMYPRPDGRWVRVIVAKVQDAGELEDKVQFSGGRGKQQVDILGTEPLRRP